LATLGQAGRHIALFAPPRRPSNRPFTLTRGYLAISQIYLHTVHAIMIPRTNKTYFDFGASLHSRKATPSNLEP